MIFSKEELSNMEFNDKFEIADTEEEEKDCCFLCGSDLINQVGYNENNNLHKIECTYCGAVYENIEGAREKIILNGEKRDWAKYLSETFEFPFVAEIIESSDQEFFNPDYAGPRYMDYVKVLEVFESFKYGVEAVIKKNRTKYAQILCFMEAADTNSRNYIELENYKRWREKYWTSDYIKCLVDAFKDKS